MEAHNPPEDNRDALALVRQRVMEHFQCSEEDTIARIMNSINRIFNEPKVPCSPLIIPPELPVPLPEPPEPIFPAEDEDPRPTSKKKPTFVDFNLDTPIDNQVPHTLSKYAVGRMEDIEYVELWYFTTEVCREASKATPSVADSTFGILATRSGLVLQPIKASKASCNAIVDQFLSWEQIMMAHHTMISVANRVGWAQKLTLTLVQFYINLEGTKSGGFNPRALILYHAVVQKQWHDALKGQGPPFNISIFNETLFIKLENQVRDKDLEEIQRQTDELQRQASTIHTPQVFIQLTVAPQLSPASPLFFSSTMQRDTTCAASCTPHPTQHPTIFRPAKWHVNTVGDCQEYYQNSALFSQFLLILCCANHFILLSFYFLMKSDQSEQQETCILVSSTATMSKTPHCYHTLYPSPCYLPRRPLGTPPY